MTFVSFWLALVSFLRLTAEFVDGLPWKDIGSRHCSVSLSLRRTTSPQELRGKALSELDRTKTPWPEYESLEDRCHEYLNFARTCLAKGAAGKVDGLSHRATLGAQPRDEEALNAALVFSVLAHN
ncbi:unnamed protein product, partial [Symbiodinium sp. CCMP2592]